MALTLGSVSIADDGTVTKSGMCGSLYDQFAAAVPAPGIPAGSAGVAIKRGLSTQAVAIATWIHSELTTNARARVAPQGDPDVNDGLQRTPNPNTADTATVAPGVEKLLKIV